MRLFPVIYLVIAIATLFASSAMAQVAGPPSQTPQWMQLVFDFMLLIVLPLAGTYVAGMVGTAAMGAGQVFGEQRAAALKAKILEALINGLTKEAGVNTPGSPTFQQAVVAAVGDAKRAYPDAIAILGAKDEGLRNMAAAALNALIEQNIATVKSEGAAATKK